MFPSVWLGLIPPALAHATRVRLGGHWLAAIIYHRLFRTSDKQVTTVPRPGSSRLAPQSQVAAENDDAPPGRNNQGRTSQLIFESDVSRSRLVP